MDDLRRSGRVALVPTLALIAALGITGSAAHQSGRPPAPRTSGAAVTEPAAFTEAAPRPADCTPHSGDPIQLGVLGTLSGVTTLGSALAVSGLTGTLCGLTTVIAPPPGQPGTACISLYVPGDGVRFNPPSVGITLIPDLTPAIKDTTITPQPLTDVICNNAPSVVINTVVRVLASASLFGATCTLGPLSIPVTGMLTGPLRDFTLTLTSGPFSVPGPTISPTCPESVTTSLDHLVALPLSAGIAHLTLTIHGGVYYP